ncbi:hypothetical protein [Weissella fangxianensis]|uniref:hypothetical protein n=1 Tax=Weissella fangxianensis TaxID=2953879 RepID=UPI0021576A71|nr:hypothetical protein [Weissella fangxianensis]
MHSYYKLPAFTTVEDKVKRGDKAAILAMDIFERLNGMTDLSYEQKEKALHLANEMLFQKLVTDKKEPRSMTENQIKKYFSDR